MKRLNKTALVLALTSGFSLTSTTLQAAPGLVDIYQLALQNDAKLAQAQAELQASEELMTQAKSYLMPNVNATVTYGKSDLDDSDPTAQAAVKLNQPLFNRKAFKGYNEAKYTVEMAHSVYAANQQELILRVAEAYFNVLLAEQNLQLAKSKEEADKIQWEKAQASSDVGLASRTDVLQARSSYDLSISDRINAENNLDVVKEQLVKLTGQSVDQIKQMRLDVSLPSLALNSVDLEQKAENDNLVVATKRYQQQITQERVEQTKSDHWVTVSFDASHTKTDCSNSGLCIEGDKTAVYINASMPLYAGGRVSSQVTQARFNSQAASIALRDAREQARLDARIGARNLERGYALVDALREAVKSSEAFLEAAEEGYRVGLRNMLDVLSARASLFQAQRNLAEALHNVVLTQLKLQSTLGDLSVDDLRDLDQLLSNPA